jgi:hypothetical protein
MATTDLKKAWSAFFEDVAVTDFDELKKQGWMTNAEIAEQSKLEGEAGRQIANIAFRRGVLEKKVGKILINGRRTNVNFYRPRATAGNTPASH